jgi:hypothetical protein
MIAHHQLVNMVIWPFLKLIFDKKTCKCKWTKYQERNHLAFYVHIKENEINKSTFCRCELGGPSEYALVGTSAELNKANLILSLLLPQQHRSLSPVYLPSVSQIYGVFGTAPFLNLQSKTKCWRGPMMYNLFGIDAFETLWQLCV